MSLLDVCYKIKDDLDRLEAKDIAKAESALADWLNVIELTDSSAVENARLRPLVEKLFNSVFKEIHISLMLSQTSNYGAACVLARGCIEKMVYILYFCDHPIAAFSWSLNGADLSFSAICEAMSIKGYFDLATGIASPKPETATRIISDLRDSYRHFSESVHGKYKYLEEVEDPNKLAADYYLHLTKAATSLKSLVELRFRKPA